MNKTIEKIEALPLGSRVWHNNADNKSSLDIIDTDDLHQLAREYRALMAVLEAAERFVEHDDAINAVSAAVRAAIYAMLVAIAEARSVIGGSDVGTVQG